MRLIDADALFPEGQVEVFENDGAKTAQKIIEHINSVPTIGVKQMAQEIARHCEDKTECHYCVFCTQKHERLCMLTMNDDVCPEDWNLHESGEDDDSC